MKLHTAFPRIAQREAEQQQAAETEPSRSLVGPEKHASRVWIVAHGKAKFCNDPMGRMIYTEGFNKRILAALAESATLEIVTEKTKGKWRVISVDGVGATQ